jgi:hypothetical protein
MQETDSFLNFAPGVHRDIDPPLSCSPWHISICRFFLESVDLASSPIGYLQSAARKSTAHSVLHPIGVRSSRFYRFSSPYLLARAKKLCQQ